MVKQLMGLAALLAMVIGMAPQAHAVGFEVAIGGWQQEFTGTLAYDDDIVSTDILDVENTFNFDKENRVFGRAKFDLPLFLPNIYLMAAPMQFEGTGLAAADIEYGNLTIPASAALDADITMNQYDVAFYWGIPALKTATAGILNIDLGLNIRWVDLEAKVAYDAGGGNTGVDKADFSAPIPMLFVACQIMPTDSFGIEAEGRGISVGENKLFSIIGRVRYNFTGPVFVAGGYRYDKLELDEDDVLADVEFSGPFLELGLQF